ncbi:MAG: hypothetical protein NTX65_13060 [Ignavibacteriales bacterium]|nr:hypothetical protein [Ignavibacteriales bacterium]
MTPKERINNAMNLMPVDKIPLMCQFSIGHMLVQLKISPAEFWFDQNIFTEGLIKLREIYDFDGILISLHGHDLKWKEKVKQIYKTGESEIVEWKNGDKTICPYNELPYFVYRTEKEKIEISDFDENLLPDTLNYIPVSQNLHFEITPENKFGSIEAIVKKCGSDFSIHGEITSPFDYFLDIVGHQNGLLGLIDNPDNCKKILSHFTKGIKKLALEMCATGIDAVKISSPFAGAGFISPDHYKEFVLPYEKEIVSAIRKTGMIVYTHTCGSINDRLELMFDAGINGIECLDPPPIGNVELSDAVARIGDKGFIKGNIDSINLLLNGTEDEIISDVKNRIIIAENNPGFILSTACSIAPETKKENILLLREVIDTWK